MGLIKLPKKSIDFFKQHIDLIFESGIFAEGPWNNKLSEFVKDLTMANYAIATNSNGTGITALLVIYKHYFNRNKALIQNNTMYGVKTMIHTGGLNLKGYIPCQIKTLMPSLKDVKDSLAKFSKSEKNSLVIVLSHIGGIINPDIEAIASLCKNENIILIEDCAHSFGATLDEHHSGLFGNAGVYSFYATKAIPVGEGGIIVTKIPEIGEMVEKYSIYDRFDQKFEIGNNVRISEIQALLTYSIVKETSDILDNKLKIAQKYIIACEEKNINYINQNCNGQKGNYYKFVIYSYDHPISKLHPNLKTSSSPVYDYSIGVPNPIAKYHACLPIWYGQESQITNAVINEL